MQKFLVLVVVSMWAGHAQAQLLDRIKSRVEQKVNQKIDRTIDQSIDKATSKKKKKESKAGEETTPPTSEPNGSNSTVGTSNDSTPSATPAAAPASPVAFTSYSRFDFVPGEKIIVHEDFSQDAIGDFPAQWNTRTGGELVTVNNRPGKWLRMNQDGVFYPEYLTQNLPENFTLQMDVMASPGIAGIGTFIISLMQTKNADEKFSWGADESTSSTPNFKIGFRPKSSGSGSIHYSSHLIGSQHRDGSPEFVVPKKNAVKVSIWRQKQRVRVYLDSTKVLDLPRALETTTALNSLVLAAYAPDYDKKEGAFFVSNIELAVGAPDTRNKLLTEGKFTTHGILFDVNSDRIKPSSFGALQDIANVLKENASLRVKIVGHTDADGNESSNLDLSKRRAESVKSILISDFGLDASRLETDGKGKTQPIDSNDTLVGKANNRRVEFLKL
ncbi:OmpA family protein [Siphonobacter sp.]|uniref:OmpA family protein n=1 Tax=Siphonobacter sp. TaxID=1869184 RepID=UPI003B3A3CC0